jgi:hypothetical protein
MTDRRTLATLTDEALADALRDLGSALAVPLPEPAAVAADPARLARLRIEAEALRSRPALPRRWLGGPAILRRRAGRSLALALIAVALIAAIAGAIGLGLPGIRVIPGGSGAPVVPSGSAGIPARSPSAGAPLGAELGLGAAVDPADVGSAVDFPVALPGDPATGAPAAAWLLDRRLTLVWPAGPTLPALPRSTVGLLLTELRGSINPGHFEKILNPRTRIEPVTVAGTTGWWISGEPHGIVYVRPGGQPEFDSRRIVGDTLLWVKDGITYRLETSLGREAAIRIAESLR